MKHAVDCPCLACWQSRIDSAAWTGDQPRRLYWWARRQLWPCYSCELCVGQEPHQGCYCDYQGAVAPGGPGAGPLRQVLREMWNWWHSEG